MTWLSTACRSVPRNAVETVKGTRTGANLSMPRSHLASTVEPCYLRLDGGSSIGQDVVPDCDPRSHGYRFVASTESPNRRTKASGSCSPPVPLDPTRTNHEMDEYAFIMTSHGSVTDRQCKQRQRVFDPLMPSSRRAPSITTATTGRRVTRHSQG